MGPKIAKEPRFEKVWGPPGTGKTTYVSEQIKKAVAEYGKDYVLVMSFTRAAAEELEGRDLELPKGRVGTLHAHCYRALGKPEIAETKIAEWNKENPTLKLTLNGSDVDEFEPEMAGGTHGDRQYARLQLLRAKMIEKPKWPVEVQSFSNAWTRWKQATNRIDFTDMIEMALTEVLVPPGSPDVIVVDEAQDLTRLQLSVVKQWSGHAQYTLLAGDDDQTIFTFAGASPEVLYETGDEYDSIVLSQSYRVPRAIHAVSQEWISKVTRRVRKEYSPRDADGEVRLLHKGNYKAAIPIIDDAERYLACGKSVMFLASCSFMLVPLKDALRDRAFAFHNPYRRKRFDWNPLAHIGKRITAADRLLAFMKPHNEYEPADLWTWKDFEMFTEWFRPDSGLVEGVAEVIRNNRPEHKISVDQLSELLKPQLFDELLYASINEPMKKYVPIWLDRLQPGKRRAAEYPAKVMLRHGTRALIDEPKIIIGTGHSVKGGEADVVYIFPDLSASGMRQWVGPAEGRDSIIRLGYVMMTRAKETLVICEPASSNFMPIAPVAAKLGWRRRLAA